MTTVGTAGATGLGRLVALAADGDQAAFARLVADFNPIMTRVAYTISGDVDLAADSVQTAWTIAWRRLGTVRDRPQIRSWLVAIAANEARQLIRKQRRRTVVELRVEEPVGSPEPSDRIEAVDLARVLRGLSPDDRALLALRFVAEMESAEIAGRLGLSASGVRSRLARLLERLRTELDHA